MSKMTNAPFAYAAVAMDASESTYVTTSREQAEAACREYGWQLVPLHAGPTLTAAEIEAVAFADAYIHQTGCRNTSVQKTLRGLLERTSGTHATPAQGSVQGR